MKNMIVTHAVPGCDLERVELEVARVSVTVKSKDGPKETFAVRCFFPKRVNGQYEFMEEISQRLFAQFEQAEGEERDECLWGILMIWLGEILPEIDEQRMRGFNIRSLDYVEEFLRAARDTKSVGLPGPERLKRIAGSIAATTARLIQEAIYKRPDIELPFSQPEYEEFRSEILEEMVLMIERLEETKRNVLATRRNLVMSSKEMSAADRAKVLALLDAIETGEESSYVSKVYQPCAEYLFKKAIEREEKYSLRFKDIVEKAKKSQEPVLNEIQRDCVPAGTEDGGAYTQEYTECVRHNFDSKAADVLLDETITRFEELFEIPPTCQEKADVAKRTKESLESVPPMQVEYLSLVHARRSEDVIAKWDAIAWITRKFVSHRECIRMLCREAESVAWGFLEYGLKQVYLKIRDRLNIHERRMFKLMYFRLPIFGYRIATECPIARSFFLGMDEQTRGLIILVLVFKVSGWGSMGGLDRELNRRWRAYLKLYPCSVEIRQDNEREAKRGEVDRKWLRSTEERLGGQGGDRDDDDDEKLTLGDTLEDEGTRSKNLIQALVFAKAGDAEDMVRKYCTKKQADHIIKRLLDDKTEVEIALEENVTKQAIHDSIIAGLKRLENGLRRDGVIE